MADKEIFGNSGPVDPKLKRTTFDKSFVNNLTCKIGKAIPVLVEECPPDSAYSIDTNFAFDFQSMWYPIQNNVTAHLSFWRVPFRILWKHYRRFNDQIGSDGKINGSAEYSMPYIKKVAGWCKQGSLADYMGLPTNFYDKADNWITQPIDYCLSRLQTSYDPARISVYPMSSGHATYLTETIVFDTPRYKIASDGKIEIRFYHNDTSLLATSIASALATDNTEFSLYYVRKRNMAASPEFEGSYITSVYGEIPVSSYAVADGHVYAINGVEVKEFVITLTLDITGDAYNAHISSDLQGNLTYVLRINSTSSVLGNYLNRRGDLGFSMPNSTTIESEKEHDDVVYQSLVPALRSFGICDYIRVHVEVPTDGNKNYFDSVEGADPVIPINALPFRAYEFIRNYYFRNSRVNPFRKVDPDTGVMQECYDEFITNDGDGADSTTPTELFDVPWEYDMFTTAVPRPIYGNAPLVGLSVNKDANGDYTTATFEMTDTETHTPYTFEVKCDPKTGGIVSINNSDYAGNSANTPVFDALNYAISCGISISDFRNADALTRFAEKRMRAGNKHMDIVKEFFGVVPPLGEEYPTYLGGVSRRIMVNKVMNVAQSEGNPLGDFAGSAVVNGKSKRIRTFCKERCYIIGLLWFSVTPLYSQQLPKHFIKSKLLDYYNPLFANISAQPIYCKEIAPLQLSSEEVDDVFGYGRPWADYVSRRDEVHGDFRGDMADFLFQRIFYTKPRLNSSFIDMNSADLTNIFSNTEDNDKIFGQVAFGIRAKLPIPRFSNPQII